MEQIQTISELVKAYSTLPIKNSQEKVSDVLTEDEKSYAIYYAIEQEKRSFFRKRTDKGEHQQDIQIKWDQVNLKELIDIEKVLFDANLRKLWKLEDEEFKRNKDIEAGKQVQALMQKCNANYFYNLVKSFFLSNYGAFIWDSNPNQHYIKAVCFFFSNDPRFETELGFSFKKGLWISGNAGLGKTKVLEAVSKNETNPISLISMVSINEKVKRDGECILNTTQTICLDDVGTEQNPVKHYGTDIYWFKEFIENYYNSYRKFHRLIITTNCDGNGIEQLYGNRIRDRLREMMNPILLEGESMRK